MREKLVNKLANLLQELENLKLSPVAKADSIIVMLEIIDYLAIQDLIEEYNFKDKE